MPSKKDMQRAVVIKRLKNGRAKVTFELNAADWAWMEELEDRRMIPLCDMLYSGFFQGMEREGWKNPTDVTTPDTPPPRTHSLRNNAPDRQEQSKSDNVVPLKPRADYDDLDDDVPF